MFDFYGMPSGWPSRKQANNVVFADKAITVESAIDQDIAAAMGDSFNPDRFFAYIQMHEFEALLFSNPQVLAETMRKPESTDELQAIVSQCGSPEEINDNPNSAPSKRLLSLFKGYNKVHSGTLAATRIGLSCMRAQCSHFDKWVCRLESL